MNKISVIIACLLITSTSLFSQSDKDVAAGVIDFLLRTPKTANKLNTTEKVALDIISDLLKVESARQHQLEYASSSSDRIVINTNDGRQAQFVKDQNGNIYILVDGEIYPKMAITFSSLGEKNSVGFFRKIGNWFKCLFSKNC